jgi:arginyl-tRNA synthetase
VEVARDYDDAEKRTIARMVGVAALKFGDLSNQPSTNYVFDLDRFASFEGKTGPYLLYAAVRIKSILRKAAEQGLTVGPVHAPGSRPERDLQLKLAMFPDQLRTAFDQRAPHYLCDYAYELASLYSGFYRDHHILREEDPARQASWLGLSRLTLEVLERVTDVLGIEVPERM